MLSSCFDKANNCLTDIGLVLILTLTHTDAMTPSTPALPAPVDSPDVYRTLLESTKAIPWRIDWATMRFTYIGPQIEALLGWSPSSWMTVNDWAERMHPEDRKKTVDFCVAQSQRGVDHEAEVFLDRIDRRLYQAKSEGRDRLCDAEA